MGERTRWRRERLQASVTRSTCISIRVFARPRSAPIVPNFVMTSKLASVKEWVRDPRQKRGVSRRADAQILRYSPPSPTVR
mgnify:CR=1 FL=1